MNDDDLRDRWPMFGLAAIAVLAAIAAALAWPAAPHGAQPDPATTAALDESDWVRAESPGPLWPAPRREVSRTSRAAEEAHIDALVRRSQAATVRAHRAAAELEASLRALRPALDGSDDPR